jgi:hypothetical protein
MFVAAHPTAFAASAVAVRRAVAGTDDVAAGVTTVAAPHQTV